MLQEAALNSHCCLTQLPCTPKSSSYPTRCNKAHASKAFLTLPLCPQKKWALLKGGFPQFGCYSKKKNTALSHKIYKQCFVLHSSPGLSHWLWAAVHGSCTCKQQWEGICPQSMQWSLTNYPEIQAGLSAQLGSSKFPLSAWIAPSRLW